MQEEEGIWSYPKEQEDFLEDFLAERRKRVKPHARMHGVSDMVTAQLIVDEALAIMGPHLARDSKHVQAVIDIELRTLWQSASASVIASIRDSDSPRTEEDSSQGSRPGSQSETPAPGATEGELRTIFGTSIAAEALEAYHDDSLLTAVTSRAPFKTGPSASTAYAEGRSVRSPSTPVRVPPADSESPAAGTAAADSDGMATAEAMSPEGLTAEAVEELQMEV